MVLICGKDTDTISIVFFLDYESIVYNCYWIFFIVFKYFDKFFNREQRDLTTFPFRSSNLVFCTTVGIPLTYITFCSGVHCNFRASILCPDSFRINIFIVLFYHGEFILSRREKPTPFLGGVGWQVECRDC